MQKLTQFRLVSRSIYSYINILLLFLGASASIGFFDLQNAEAAQRARVIVDNAAVLNTPQNGAEVAAQLEEGAALYVSSQFLETSDGLRWHKVFLDSGKFGFIRSTEIQTETASQALRSSGLAATHEWATEDAGVWSVALRVLGLGGVPLGGSGSFVGADAELSFCLALWTRSVWRQFVSLGAHAQYMGALSLIGGTFVLRIPTLGRAVPEFRLRGSTAFPGSGLYWGGSAGVQYPFTNNPGFHVSGSMEAGAASPFNAGAVYAWFAAGIGLHF